VSQDKIVVVGARENNLKNITVEIPREKLVVITGLSGSGKSSLAFDTIYAEGQRRYVESLSAYARQFLGQMDKPDVDHIDGLSPAVSIDQKSASRNPRSTVGTVTEIYDYLRILFARAGTPFCPNGHGPIERQSTDQIVDIAKNLPDGARLQILAPVVRGRKGEYKSVLQDINKAGYVRVRVDGEMYEVTDDIPMDRYKQHTIEVVVDRLVVKEGLERRLSDSIEAALKMGKGVVTLSWETPKQEATNDERRTTNRSGGGRSAKRESQEGAGSPIAVRSPPESQSAIEQTFSESYSCSVCGFSMPELEPRMFSFNSPYGMCSDCTGLGTKTEFDPQLIVPDESKPVRDGAILPFLYKSGEAKEWWPELLEAVGRATGFDANEPFSKLNEEQRHAVFYGLDEQVRVKMRYGRTEREIGTNWSGVLASLRKRYEQTESEWVKQDLEQYMSTKPCPACHGRRLKPESLAVRLPIAAQSAEEATQAFSPNGAKTKGKARKEMQRAPAAPDEDGIGGTSIADVASMSVEAAVRYFQELPEALNERQLAIAERAVREIDERLRFLLDVGLGYLTLDRSARTLAGGEAQRIRLATQIGSGLMGCLYILDEPSIGLHQRDNRRLIETLVRLRDLGNTVIVVEHDEETMLAADWLIDLGPGAGEHGGEVVAEGTPEDFRASDSLTAQYLRGERRIEIPQERRKPASKCPL
jgi:excinuclease ABC subunit A